jgi:hypothetical protein
MVALGASATVAGFGRDDGPALGRKGAILIGLVLLHVAIVAALVAEDGRTASSTKREILTTITLLPLKSSFPAIPFVPPADAGRWQPPPLSMPRIVVPADQPNRAQPRDPCAPGQDAAEEHAEIRPDCGPPVPTGLNMPKGFQMDETGRPIENGTFTLPQTPEDVAAVAKLIEQRNRALQAAFGLKNPDPTSAEKRSFQGWERDIVPIAPTNNAQRALKWNDEFLQPGSISPSIPPLPE